MQQQQNNAATKLAVIHYLNQMKRDWRIVVPAFLLPIFGSVLVFYAPPLVIAKILGKFNHQAVSGLSQFVPYLLLLALVWGMGELFWRIGIYFQNIADYRGMKHLYSDAIALLFQKDLGFFHNNFAGALTKRVSAYGGKYETVLDTLSFNILANYVPILFACFILWRYTPWLVAGLLGLLVITASIILPLIRRRTELVAARETASTRMTGYVADMIGNVDAIKAFAHEDSELKTHRRNVKDYMDKALLTWHYHNSRVSGTASPMYVITNILGLVVAIVLSKNHTANLQEVFVVFSYYATATRVIFDFNNVYRNLESSFYEAAQFTQLLLDEPKVNDIEQPEPLHVEKGAIELRDLEFGYSDSQGEHLFDRLNLKIAPGEKVAFVGHSGGGKTTITRLLLRFMDIQSGQILIDGQDIAKVKQRQLRSSIAYVPQEPTMFHRSLADNIRYGRPEASDDEVKRIAKLAHAHEFIKDLPNQYETLVGERGVKLSGGQRQRIAIARAMIKDAPILILDEATSALDSDSERLIQDALWKLMEGKTTIAIAHRLSTIQRMDRIIVLEEGKIAEEGSHKELLEAGGVYAMLWAHQSGGFIDE